MGFINSTPSGKYRANWRDPSGKQRAKTFRTKREAKTFLARIETEKAQGSYVSPMLDESFSRTTRNAGWGHGTRSSRHRRATSRSCETMFFHNGANGRC